MRLASKLVIVLLGAVVASRLAGWGGGSQEPRTPPPPSSGGRGSLPTLSARLEAPWRSAVAASRRGSTEAARAVQQLEAALAMAVSDDTIPREEVARINGDVRGLLVLVDARKLAEQGRFRRASSRARLEMGTGEHSPEVQGLLEQFVVQTDEHERHANAELFVTVRKAVRDRDRGRAERAIAEARRRGVPSDVLQRAAAELSMLAPADRPVVTGLDFIFVAEGDFRIGTPSSEDGRDGVSELVPQTVHVRGFFLSSTEVTQRAYASVVPTRWSQYIGPSLPAHTIGYEDAEEFCRRLSARDGRYTYALPDEVEWEVACRAGRPPEEGPFAANPEDAVIFKNNWQLALQKYAVFRDHNPGVGPAEVAKKSPNPLGFYDMLGNVSEWCRPVDGNPKWYEGRLGRKPTRGGSFTSGVRLCRAGARSFELIEGEKPKASIGFRVLARPR